LIVRPVFTAAQSYQWRVYAEWQRSADKGTDLSLPHLFNDRHRFGPNIVAPAAREFGTALVLRGAKGVSTQGATVGAELAMDAAWGSFDYARTSLTTRLTVPLSERLLTGLELAAGTTGGDAPAQGLWYLGGPATLRGYAGGVVGGPDYWRARLELANASPGARLAVFSDAGWAGRGTALTTGRPLVAVGIGGSFFDGILRIDLARALVSPTGWRMDVYVDGIL
jgi:hemolysin activation/secretion protein